jgi:gliding motility-associated-like protein
LFYYCLITFSNGGCGNLVTDIAKVDINPNPIVILNDEQISEGEELKFCEGDTIYVKAKGAEKYIWNAGNTGDSISIWNIGDYRVVGVSKAGCMDTFNFSASYFDLMYYAIESDKNELTNEQSELHLWSEEILNSYYSWDFGDGETGSGYDVTHVYDITQDGYFDVDLIIINPFGCTEYAIKRIWTSLETTPNTFTPNGDGINDYYLDGWYKKIYNRNGILLYEGKEGWDGTYNGRDVANDTYFVIIYDSSEIGTKYKTNYVTVIR